MTQSALLLVTLAAVFVIYIIMKGRLPHYAYALGLGRERA